MDKNFAGLTDEKNRFSDEAFLVFDNNHIQF